MTRNNMDNGKTIENSAIRAMKMLQKAMEGEAERAGLRSDEDVVQLIAEMRTEESAQNTE